MKILSTNQIRAWDQYTIENLPISSIDLMEKAAIKCVKWLQNNFSGKRKYILFIGTGNNGGDGLAMARFLKSNRQDVDVFALKSKPTGSDDFNEQLKRAREEGIPINSFQEYGDFIKPTKNDLLIDALFGTGLNRAIEGDYANFLEKINNLPGIKISIDIPSGISADFSFTHQAVFKADYTLSFQVPKLAFLLPENDKFIGDWKILDIGLMLGFLDTIPLNTELLDPNDIQHVLKPRPKYAHKGTFGHTLLLGGSFGMTGAILLASKAAMRMGTGLLTVSCLPDVYGPLLTSLPEAMSLLSEDSKELVFSTIDYAKFTAIGIGPGLNKKENSLLLLKEVLANSNGGLVIDADAINLLGKHKGLLDDMPKQTILTPHVKEFDRITNTHTNHEERIRSAREFAIKYDCILVLKGAYTAVVSSEGKCYFNATGNPGMATGGSGDVLLGMIAALLAQGISPIDAARFGVYIHGVAGDLGARKVGEHSLIPSDIIDFLPVAIQSFYNLEY